MKRIDQRIKLVCLLAFSFISGVQATSLAAPLMVINCSTALLCNEGILNAADINTEAIIKTGVERDYSFAIADDRDYSGAAIGHPFASFLNADNRKFESFSDNDSVYDTDLTLNSIADDASLKINLTARDYAVAVVDVRAGSAEESYTESLLATSIPPAILLLGSGVLGLVVITRRKRNDATSTFAAG